MEYANMRPGKFLARPNRFIAHIEIDGSVQICHVKNTGRCKELLIPGCAVWCQESDKPERKTKFDLIAVQKGDRLINMDSQAPNAASKEWLASGGLGEIENLRAEVKGVTLETDGVCAFPDAPTERGVKHLEGLTQLSKEGFGAYVLFVIQMEDVRYLHPNYVTDPAFAKALQKAAAAGVHILAVDCAVTPSTMVIQNPVEVQL